MHDGARRRPGRPRVAWRCGAVAVVFPALGLSYYRLRISEIAPSASTGTAPLTDKIKGLQVPVCARGQRISSASPWANRSAIIS